MKNFYNIVKSLMLVVIASCAMAFAACSGKATVEFNQTETPVVEIPDPTDPIVDPVDPSDPTDPVDPSDPSDPSDPTEPVDPPTDPVVDPYTPPTDPYNPPVDPYEPPTDPETYSLLFVTPAGIVVANYDLQRNSVFGGYFPDANDIRTNYVPVGYTFTLKWIFEGEQSQYSSYYNGWSIYRDYVFVAEIIPAEINIYWDNNTYTYLSNINAQLRASALSGGNATFTYEIEGLPQGIEFTDYLGGRLQGVITADVGQYEFTVTATCVESGVSKTETFTFGVGMKQISVDVSVVGTLTYNGEEQSPNVIVYSNDIDGDFYSITNYNMTGNAVAVNANNYTACLVLKDEYAKNYRFWNGTAMTFSWSIERQYVKSPTIINGSNNVTYDGQVHELEFDVDVKNGFYVLNYGNKPVINAGTYTLNLSLTDNKNYSIDGYLAQKSYTLVIKKANHEITPIVSTTTMRYGDEVPSISTTEDGAIEWVAGQAWQTVGTVTRNWVFTPTDTVNYNTLNGNVTIVIIKGLQVINNVTLTADFLTTAYTVSLSNLGSTYEYSNDGATWQSANTFSNPEADVVITYYARLKSTTYLEPSDPISVEKLTTPTTDEIYSNNSLATTALGNGYLSRTKTLTVPQSVKGANVTSLTTTAYQNRTSLEKIFVPNTITQIGSGTFVGVFSGCNNVQEITYPYGSRVYSTTNVQYALANIFGVSNENLPTSLYKVTFNNSGVVSAVGQNCNYVTEIVFGDSVVGTTALPPNLETLYVGNAFTAYYAPQLGLAPANTTIGSGNNNILFENNVFYNPQKNQIFAVSKDFSGEYVVPTTINDVADKFAGKKGLTGIVFHTGITEIVFGAFSGCVGITEIVIPSSITQIGSNAFLGCVGITEIVIPSSITQIDASAFSGCDNMTKITIPFIGKSRTATGKEAIFSHIFGFIIGGNHEGHGVAWNEGVTSHWDNVPVSLKTVIITGGTIIKEGAFRNLVHIENLVLPTSITIIETLAFAGATGIKSLLISNATTIKIDKGSPFQETTMTIYIAGSYSQTTSATISIHGRIDLAKNYVVQNCTFGVENGHYYVISGNIFSSAGVHNDIAKYAPYREGYEFSGWSSTENGSEVEYAFDEMLEASRVYYTMEDGSVVLSVNERRPFYAVYDIH